MPLRQVEVGSAAALEELFSAEDYDWPPSSGASVPRLALTSLPEDLGDRAVQHKKSLFMRSLLPLVLAENRRLRAERAFLRELFHAGLAQASSRDWERAEQLKEQFRVSGDLTQPGVQRLLLSRVDVVPPSLALAQAAIETGWGTSRFALQGNSLFGQWTWQQDAGIAPAQRDEGANHAVRAFPTLRGSVRAYFHNLNTNSAYKSFRAMRARMRAAGEPLDPIVLADGLKQYSQRGGDYVAELKSMISGNGLHDSLEGVRLVDLDTEIATR